MPIRRLSAPVTALYAELLDLLLIRETQRSIAHLRGGFTSKILNDRRYWYFQYRDIRKGVRQIYIGPDNDAARHLIRQFEEGRHTIKADEQHINELAAMLRRGEMHTVDSVVFKVLQALSDSGLFKRGAVLVGTHAFVALGNLLGVKWVSPASQTQDIDLAQDSTVGLALPEASESVDLPAVLDNLQMGFLPVPPLNPKDPSTSFKIRGRSLRLDLLTPATGRRTKPVPLTSLKAAAQPVRFLDYLLELPERAALLGRSAILVNVPDPARFAIHKLIVSQHRIAAFHTKAAKDRAQAAQLLEVLAEERPSELKAAWKTACKRGARWSQAALAALTQIEKLSLGDISKAREILR